MTERMAEVSRTALSRPTEPELARYLYHNYRISDVSPVAFWIRGEDDHGFTLDAIIDRLASGLIAARELTGQELTDALASYDYGAPCPHYDADGNRVSCSEADPS